MSVVSYGSERAQRTVFVPLGLDIELKKKAAELQIDKSDLYELGARIILAILESKHVPDDLGYILAERDPEALSRLRELVERLQDDSPF